jgi:hypothetical protein
MKTLILVCALCTVAVPAFADFDLFGGDRDGREHHHGAPAPLIGAGIPVAVAVGGALLGWKFFKRK